MTDKADNYNLLVKPWIPILWTHGKPERVSIRTALIEAGRIRQIAASNPMDNVALLRFLLVVLQWCKSSLTGADRERLEREGGVPDDWLKENLGGDKEPNREFDLLTDKGGFYQDASAEGPKVAVTNLLHDLPSGSKIAHFRHTRDGRDGMCLPCCALGLARWPGVASAGTAGRGQSMTASLNGNAPAYSVHVGANLLCTFLLTWPSPLAVKGDAPVWHGANEQSPLGFLKGMTWRSRCVLLAPPHADGKRDLSPGRCCYCAEPTDRLVRWIRFRPGWARPSKEPWPDDPHLLRVSRKDARSAKEKNIVPSCPNPNEPLEEHAGVWRSLLEGHLRRPAGSDTGTREFHTTLLANSQALYKHAATHTTTLPEMGSGVRRRLLTEMEWLRKLTQGTASAQARNWGDPPRGHFVIGALCAPRAKGHAIRSGLCALSPPAERELESSFFKLMHRLAICDQTDSDVQGQVLGEWRDEALRIIGRHVRQVVDSTTAGSPLRRREAAEMARQMLNQAIEKLAANDMKAANPATGKKPKREPRKRGRA